MKTLELVCPYCKASAVREFSEHFQIGSTVGVCYSCGKTLLTISAIETDSNRPELVRYIYSYVYQHCINHPEIMFNQIDCPMCKLEKNLKELGESKTR